MILEILKGMGWLKDGDNVINLSLFIGSWAAIKSVAVGLWLSQMGAYPEDFLFIHKMLGFAITLLAAILLFIRVEIRKRAFVFVSWAFLLVGMTVAGEIGGKMTHGDGFTTEYAPGWIQSFAGTPPTL